MTGLHPTRIALIRPERTGDDVQWARVVTEHQWWERRLRELRKKAANADSGKRRPLRLAMDDLHELRTSTDYEAIAKAAGRVGREARRLVALEKLVAFEERAVDQGRARWTQTHMV